MLIRPHTGTCFKYSLSMSFEPCSNAMFDRCVQSFTRMYLNLCLLLHNAKALPASRRVKIGDCFCFCKVDLCSFRRVDSSMRFKFGKICQMGLNTIGSFFKLTI